MKEYYKRNLIRGIYLLVGGGVVSGLTYYLFPDQWVRYGILSFIGTAIISSSFIVGNYKLVGILSMIILTLLLYLKNNILFLNDFCYNNNLFCFILGIKNVSYNALDHFGFIPNIIYVLLGILLGYTLYRGNKRQFPIKFIDNYDDQLKSNCLTRISSFIGKHSLEIYLIHWIIFYLIIKFFASYNM